MPLDENDLPSNCDEETMAAMRHVSGREAQLALRAQAREMIEVFRTKWGASGTQLSNEWLGTHNWRVQLLRQRVLAISTTHRMAFSPLVALLKRRGSPALFGTDVSISSLADPTAVWRVALDTDSISRFFEAHRFSFHMLFPEDRSFAIHGSEDTYAVFAGPEAFLREALPPELQGPAVTADLKRYMEHDFGKGALDPVLAHYDPFLLEE
jgi:hypothetical protein